MEGTARRRKELIGRGRACRMLVAGLLVLLAPLPPALPGDAAGAAPAQVRRVAYSHGPRYARVVIEASREIPFSTRSLPGDSQRGLPPRLFVDLSPALRGQALPEQLSGQGVLVRRVRVGQFQATTVRVVIDLAGEIGSHQVLTLYDPFRIVLDLYGVPEKAALPLDAGRGEARDPIAELLGGAAPPAGESPTPVAAATPGPRIFLDPGHGGKDPGAIGPGGTQEKDVVLGVARRLGDLLTREGYRAELTRTDDRYLALSERTRFVNERATSGDIFISIHANSSPKHRVSGTETYYWNVAVDRSNAATVARENFTNLDAVFRHESSDLQAILSDLKYKEKERASALLAGHLQRGLMGALTRLHPRSRDIGVQHGPLYVLALTNTPAALVETAFLSNPTEEKRLRRGSYQQALARGLLEGIKKYLRERARGATP